MDESAMESGRGDEVSPKGTRYSSGFAPMSVRVIVGIVLIFFGIDLMIELATGVDVPTVAAGVGAGFLLFWRSNRGYGWLVAGAILLGVGLGNAFALLVAPVLGESFERLMLAGGFALIPILDSRHRSNWAWIPAVILGLVGIVGMAIDIDEVISPQIAAPILPALAIIAGTVLLFRDRLSSAAFRAILALTVAVGVAVASVSGFFTPEVVIDPVRSHSETRRFVIPELEGRRLVVRTRGSIQMRTGSLSGRAVMSAIDRDGSRARARLSTADVEVVETDQLVRVSVDDADVLSDFDISAPEGSDVQLETGPGEIVVDAGGFGEVRISTGSGDVEVVGYCQKLVVRTGSGKVSLREADSPAVMPGHVPDVDIATGSGDVALEISQQVALEISTASGELEIEGEQVSRSQGFTRNGSQGSIIVRTGSGDVNVVEAAAR